MAKKVAPKRVGPKKADPKKARLKKGAHTKNAAAAARSRAPARTPASAASDASAGVLDRLYAVIESRRDADPELSHSARLLSRGTAKVAQKFGEEAVECLIEAVGGNPDALIAESADVLYHMLVMWVDAGIAPGEVWAELQRREGVSGIAEKAGRARKLSMSFGTRTTKIP